MNSKVYITVYNCLKIKITQISYNEKFIWINDGWTSTSWKNF